MPTPVSAEATRRARIMAVIQVTTGNFLEMYDFLVFGYYAAAIGRTFFPKTSEFACKQSGHPTESTSSHMLTARERAGRGIGTSRSEQRR
jgi:hypothetical protein